VLMPPEVLQCSSTYSSPSPSTEVSLLNQNHYYMAIGSKMFPFQVWVKAHSLVDGSSFLWDRDRLVALLL
jgi:hypothetical protein